MLHWQYVRSKSFLSLSSNGRRWHPSCSYLCLQDYLDKTSDVFGAGLEVTYCVLLSFAAWITFARTSFCEQRWIQVDSSLCLSLQISIGWVLHFYSRKNAWSCSAVSQIESGMAWEIWRAKILECLLSLHGIKLLRFWMHCWSVLFLHSMVSCRLLFCVAAACTLRLLRNWMVPSLLNWYYCIQSSVRNPTKSGSEFVWQFGFLVTLHCK